LPDLRRILGAFWLAAGICCASVSSAASPAETLQACAAKADPTIRGLAALATPCPGLGAALTELGYPDILPADWQEQITGKQLLELATLANRYRGVAPSSTPGVDSVKAILDQLAAERRSKPKSWWERFEDWFRSWFSGRSEKDLSWIERWLDKLASVSGVFTLMTFAFVLLVIVAAIVYVLNELRLAGVFARAEAGSAPRAGGPPSSSEASGLAKLEQTPILEQPALLLACVVQCLKRGGRLTAERHLTHRELPRAARLDAPDQRDRLTHLAAVAETVLYGAQPPAVSQVESALREGRKLLLELQGAAS
jgi:hypothetical protein